MTHLADPEGLDKWRRANDEQEARFAEERESEAWRARGEIATVRNELRSELTAALATVYANANYRANVTTEAVGEVVGSLRAEITEHVEAMIKEIRSHHRDLESELFRLVEKRFAELAGRLDLIAPETQSRRGYRFASEKSGDAVELLPEFIAPRDGELN